MKPRIILASKSRVRKQLLEDLNIQCSVLPSTYKEKNTLLKNEGFEHVAIRLALEKAGAVSKKNSNSVIIGVDSFAVIDGKILGKPHTKKIAKEYLLCLSNKTHVFYTGLAVINTNNNTQAACCTKTYVSFRKLSLKDIHCYIERENVLKAAGAYKIQGLGALFINKLVGDFYSVVGLPLNKLTILLQKVGIDIFEYIPKKNSKYIQSSL